MHDERLWMGIARATGAPGNTSCLVGTPEQIASAVLRYYRLGIHSFLLRGFENPQDTVAIGRDLIPLIRAGALENDREVQAAEWIIITERKEKHPLASVVNLPLRFMSP